MAEDFVQVAPDNPAGKKIRNLSQVVGPNTVEQQVVTLAFADGTLVPNPIPVTGSSGGGPATIVDGGDVAEGATTDAAVTSDANGTISAKLRGLVKIFASVWDSVNGRLKVDGSAVTQPVNGTVGLAAGTQVIGHVIVDSAPSAAVTIADGANVVEGMTTDAAVVSDANGTISGKLRGLVKILAAVWNGTNALFGDVIDRPARVLGYSKINWQDNGADQTATWTSGGQADVVVPVDGYASVILQFLTSGSITGGTVQITGSIDGGASYGPAMLAWDYTNQTFAPTAANSTNFFAIGQRHFKVTTLGYTHIKTHVSGFTGTGNCVVTAHAARVPAVFEAFLVNQGINATTVNAWPIKVTDGTRTAAVKAASTAAVAADQSLVVTLSPNNTGAVEIWDGTNIATVAPANANIAFNSSQKLVTIMCPESSFDVTTGVTRQLVVAGRSNDGTPQFSPIPEGPAGRSVIVEGVPSGVAVGVSAASLPLPTGAATDASLATIIADLLALTVRVNKASAGGDGPMDYEWIRVRQLQDAIALYPAYQGPDRIGMRDYGPIGLVRQPMLGMS